ncbi:MAG: DMT family transporter [Austwickia sp.]|jgi:drug/metabolite transporter (DMT)-like permease|nr:MAG: DMT family transporter [Austwickia sp.]
MEAPLGPVLALGAALSFGISDFAGGMVSRRRPAIAVVGVSQAISLVVVVAVALVVGWPTEWGALPWAAAAGLCGAAALVLFYQALAVGTVGVVSPISALGAVIPVTLGLLAGERPAPVTVAGIVVALVGAVLASGPELAGEPHVKGRAVLYAAGAALGFGLAMYGLARGAGHSVLATLVGMRLTSVTAFAVAAVAYRSVGGIRPRDLPVLGFLGVADVGANLLLAVATTMALMSVSTVLAALYPVVTVALAAALLHERMRPVQIAGTVLALIGVALIAVR